MRVVVMVLPVTHTLSLSCPASHCEYPLFRIDSIVRKYIIRGTVGICTTHKTGFLYSHGPFGRFALSC